MRNRQPWLARSSWTLKSSSSWWDLSSMSWRDDFWSLSLRSCAASWRPLCSAASARSVSLASFWAVMERRRDEEEEGMESTWRITWPDWAAALLARGRVAPRRARRIKSAYRRRVSVAVSSESYGKLGASSASLISKSPYLPGTPPSYLGHFIAVLPPSNICYHVSRFLLVPLCFHNDRR